MLLACTAAAAPPTPKCAVTEDMIAGSWLSVKGGSFEEMAFERAEGKRVFNSWLHQRPEYSGGEWKLEGCRLRISVEPAGASFDFVSVRVRRDRLYLKEGGSASESVYKRIK